MSMLRYEGVAISRSPPLVGDYCFIPCAGREGWDCTYRASTCAPDGNVCCGRCGYSFCAYHLGKHIVPFAVPRKSILAYLRRLREQMKQIAEGRRKRVRVPAEALTPENVGA